MFPIHIEHHWKMVETLNFRLEIHFSHCTLLISCPSLCSLQAFSVCLENRKRTQGHKIQHVWHFSRHNVHRMSQCRQQILGQQEHNRNRCYECMGYWTYGTNLWWVTSLFCFFTKVHLGNAQNHCFWWNEGKCWFCFFLSHGHVQYWDRAWWVYARW